MSIQHKYTLFMYLAHAHTHTQHRLHRLVKYYQDNKVAISGYDERHLGTYMPDIGKEEGERLQDEVSIGDSGMEY